MHLAKPMVWIAVLAVAGCVHAQSRQRQTLNCKNWFNNEHLGQSGMNYCAAEDTKRSDQELNRVYQQLLAKVKTDVLATNKIKMAERAWVAYRDAEIDAMWPLGNAMEYGSVNPMCVYMYRKDLIDARIKQLKFMLSSESGDVCAYAHPMETSLASPPASVKEANHSKHCSSRGL
ncbi:MAG: lysozyme inhibitor LprI family protein [Acidobacteriaceae bacterium]|nr:lysozyme inhibitor LprI family protein [Acidobacteriaceae bacterium]